MFSSHCVSPEPVYVRHYAAAYSQLAFPTHFIPISAPSQRVPASLSCVEPSADVSPLTVATSDELEIQYPRLPGHAFRVTLDPAGTPSASASPASPALPRTQSITIREREQFVRDVLPSRIQVMLDQPFGKDRRCSPSFVSEASFRHVLLLLFRSRLLSETDWGLLATANVYAFLLLTLLRDYDHLDFRSLRGYPAGWQEETDLNYERLRLTTAAVLHWNGDLATTVRYLGGPHVGAHRDARATLAAIRDLVCAEVYAELERLWTHGAPAVCNAAASEANFQAYRKYGNHTSVLEDSEKTWKALVKENKRGACLTMDPRLLHFLHHAHLTPQGMVDLCKVHKTPRPIFDSSFRPKPWCMAINDWTHKSNEPRLVFPAAFKRFCTYLYNLRISYPEEELYAADDDCSGAFRINKYHPNMVPMHCYIIEDVLAAATGTTFGDNTSPGNWEPIARARQELAQHFWHQPDIVARARPYLPSLGLAPQPSPAEIAAFQRADGDRLNRGVLLESGERRPPTYDHHVDDNMYADVEAHLVRGISASAIALFELLGYPCAEAPNPLSLDKLNTYYSHQRKIVGAWIDTRELSIGLIDYKRVEAIEILDDWIDHKPAFCIREASVLHGTLLSISEYTRWGRALFFTVQNILRTELQKLYHVLARYHRKRKRSRKIERALSPALQHRLSHLVHKKMTKLLWNSGKTIRMTPRLRAELQAIRSDLADPNSTWSKSIGHHIPRIPHAESFGDASHDGGGAHCPTLRYWFYVLWDDRIWQGCRLPPSDPGYVHINCLEFIVVLLQLAAAIVAFQTFPTGELLDYLARHRLPAEPIVLCWCDNTTGEHWTNKVTSKSLKGQNLVRIYAEILRSTHLGLNCQHISSDDNDPADTISRPPSPPLPHLEWCNQIYQKAEYMRTWRFFLPSPELSQLLHSALFSAPWPGRPSLPANLGHFVPDASTISSSPML